MPLGRVAAPAVSRHPSGRAASRPERGPDRRLELRTSCGAGVLVGGSRWRSGRPPASPATWRGRSARRWPAAPPAPSAPWPPAPGADSGASCRGRRPARTDGKGVSPEHPAMTISASALAGQPCTWRAAAAAGRDGGQPAQGGRKGGRARHQARPRNARPGLPIRVPTGLPAVPACLRHGAEALQASVWAEVTRRTPDPAAGHGWPRRSRAQPLAGAGLLAPPTSNRRAQGRDEAPRPTEERRTPISYPFYYL